ncbi:MAG: discoidin domain-containing protein, partial [Polyangiaceae bacterium]
RLEVERSVSWLRGLVEPRSTAQLKRSRIFRLILASAAILVTLVAVGGWGVGKLVSAKNIALGKPVQLSSRRASCGTPSPEGLPGSGLVDGNHSGAYDICTNSEVNPWATIDLGQPHTLTQVKVYNRDDCCWGLYDLPAVVEISVDGAAYTEVARQTSAYTASKPWVVPLDNKSARYVRVRVDGGSQPRELVLTEVEIFGKR